MCTAGVFAVNVAVYVNGSDCLICLCCLSYAVYLCCYLMFVTLFALCCLFLSWRQWCAAPVSNTNLPTGTIKYVLLWRIVLYSILATHREWYQSSHLTFSKQNSFMHFQKCRTILYQFKINNYFLLASMSYLSGLNPSSSSRKMLLLVTVLSWLGMMRNFRMVPRLDPRNKTVRFLWGPASVSTTILFSWYLHNREIEDCINATKLCGSIGTSSSTQAKSKVK